MNARKLVVAASILCVALAGLAVYGLGTNNAEPQQSACPLLNIAIDRTNSVHGLKDGKLFSYVDLNEYTPSLACHSKQEIVDFLLPVVSAEVSEWWKEPRLASADTAEVHVISILNKDEYARANFGSAVTYGVIKYRREAGIAKMISYEMDFK